MAATRSNRGRDKENAPLIIGMGHAAELARKHLPCYDKKVRPLRDDLEEGILRSIPNTELNGHKTQRLLSSSLPHATCHSPLPLNHYLPWHRIRSAAHPAVEAILYRHLLMIAYQDVAT